MKSDRTPETRETLQPMLIRLGLPMILVLGAASPAFAEIRPYASATLSGGLEGSLQPGVGFASFPLRSVNANGPIGGRADASFEGGLDVGLTPELSMYGGLGLMGTSTLGIGAINGVYGSAMLQGTAALPAGFVSNLGFTHRDDFAGYRSDDLVGALQHAIPFEATGFVDVGYQMTQASVPDLAHQGFFGDIGATKAIGAGTSLSADLGLSGQAYPGARTDLLTTATLGLKQALAGGWSIWGRGGAYFNQSSTADQSYLAPALTVGTTWTGF